MKKLTALVLILVTALSLFACGGNTTKEKSYAGMSAVFVGDSITNGAELAFGEPIYWQIVSENLQLGETTGMGINGSCYSVRNDLGKDYAPLTTRYHLIPQADLIFIALGCNDFGRNVPMGQLEDQEDVSFYGAINTSLNALAQQCPDAQIILLTPIPRHTLAQNDLELTLQDYADAIKAVAAARQLPVIDLYTLTADSLTEGLYTDGVHPNQYGHQIMAQTIQTWLEENVETIGK